MVSIEYCSSASRTQNRKARSLEGLWQYTVIVEAVGPSQESFDFPFEASNILALLEESKKTCSLERSHLLYDALWSANGSFYDLTQPPNINHEGIATVNHFVDIS
jgi:hypothetical protein